MLYLFLILSILDLTLSIKDKGESGEGDFHEKSMRHGNNHRNTNKQYCNISIPSLEFLGMGYDAVIGDSFSNSDSHSDVGYKSQIIEIPIDRWDYNKTIPRNFNIYSLFNSKCRVDGLWIRKSTSCEQRAIPSFMKKTESLYSNDRHYIGDLINKKVVKLAIKNNKLKNSVKSNNSINVDKLICSIYEAGIIVPTKFKYKQEFINSIKTLPKHFKLNNKCPVKLFIDNPGDSRCRDVKPWIDFFIKFGTHIITSILVGGQMINNESYSNVANKVVGKNLENDESESRNKSYYKSLTSTKKSTSDQWSIGGIPKGKLFLGNYENKKSEYPKWARSVYERPMPIQCVLGEMFSISMDKNIKKLIRPYRNALKYYYEIFGAPGRGGDMSRGIFNTLDKLMNEMDIIIQEGKYPFSHCKVNEEVVVGFSVKKGPDKIEFEYCEPGRDGCIGRGENESSLVFILCSKDSNELITSLVDNNEVKCPENYIIALGFTWIERSGESLLVDCKLGDIKCGIEGNSTWIMCVHENVPGIRAFKGTKFKELKKMIESLK